MIKKIKINGKEHTIKVRERYAPKEQVIPNKKKYNRKKKHKNRDLYD